MFLVIALCMSVPVGLICMAMRLVQNLHIFKFVTFARDESETSKG
jgi:hypothetical protein